MIENNYKIYKAKITKIDNEFIYAEIPDLAKSFRTNIVLVPAFFNSKSNLQIQKPKINDEIFVIFEDGKFDAPNILLLGRYYFKDLKEDTSYLRTDNLYIFKSNTEQDSDVFINADFKSKKYTFQISQTILKMNTSQINIQANTLDINTQSQINMQTNILNINAQASGIIKSNGPLTISGKPLTLSGLSMTLSMSSPEGSEANLGGKKLVFQNGTIEFNLGNSNKEGIVIFSELKSKLETLINWLESHTHSGYGVDDKTDLETLKSQLDDFKSQKLILKE